MFRTLSLTRNLDISYRIAAIGIFTLATAASSYFEFGEPVPYTLQVLVVLLSGMVLGSRDGAASQLAYLGLIALGFPFDARHVGSAALTGFTAGYLYAFVPAAWVAGFLIERGAKRVWQRWLAGLVGVAIIYALGFPWFKFAFPNGTDWARAWELSVTPFIVVDIVKALVAAALTESSRWALLRLLNPAQE